MASTQAALYDGLSDDLHLSWSEAELPERERTKHVHRLHPYLGKFVPQLVEALLDRYVKPGGRVLDPFAGSGTTLVQCLESGYDAVGIDIAAFNCLLMRVKTAEYDLFQLETDLRGALDRRGRSRARPRGYLRGVVRPAMPPRELLHFRSILDDYAHADVLRVVLARAARSARLTAHFDLDFPREPRREPYWCHKHRRTCAPVQEADKFLARYLLDTLERIKAFQKVRARGRAATVLHGDATEEALEGPVRRDPHLAAVPGPHRLPRAASLRVRAPRPRRPARARARRRGSRDEQTCDRGVRERDLPRPAAARGRARAGRTGDRRRQRSARPVSRRSCERSGLRLVDRLERHVNRRTGRRSGEYFESILVSVRET